MFVFALTMKHHVESGPGDTKPALGRPVRLLHHIGDVQHLGTEHSIVQLELTDGGLLGSDDYNLYKENNCHMV